MPRTVVLGIGNTLLSDEGLGVHAVRSLARTALAAEVELIDGGTLSFTLAVPLAGADQLVVIDAANLNAPAGTVRTYIDGAMDRFLGEIRSSSVHEINLRDLLDMGRLTGEIPARRALVAVQPGTVETGNRLTPEVSQALPHVLQAVQTIYAAWSS